MRTVRFLMLLALAALAVVLLIQTGKNAKESPPAKALAAFDRAKTLLLEDVFRNVAAALDMYSSENNGLPASLSDLVPQYLTRESEMVDPWGTPLQFRGGEAAGYTLVSAGPDRHFGSGDDIARSSP